MLQSLFRLSRAAAKNFAELFAVTPNNSALRGKADALYPAALVACVEANPLLETESAAELAKLLNAGKALFSGALWKAECEQLGEATVEALTRAEIDGGAALLCVAGCARLLRSDELRGFVAAARRWLSPIR